MTTPLFYVGLNDFPGIENFDRVFVSVNRLHKRKKPIAVKNWIMDSGAYSQVVKHGGYEHGVADYAAQIARWSGIGNLEAAVAQDFMCEPHILTRTGLTVKEHQALTIDRYRQLLDCYPPVYIMPVLQGRHPLDYVDHIRMYGALLPEGQWVGVGSVARRHTNVLNVLTVIKRERPDLMLHGFGLKTKALQHPGVRSMLYSADSMAWSFAARYEGRNANSWREAKAFEERINALIEQDAVNWTRPLL